MSPRALFVIASDPRSSHRPAEAIRIAAGVGAWKKVEVSVYLCGPAILALSQEPSQLMRGDDLERYLPVLEEASIYVEKSSPFLKELGSSAGRYQALSEIDFAGLAAQQTYLLRF